MSSYLWPNDEGWPYPDSGPENVDLAAGADDDVLSLQGTSTHVFDQLDPLERAVITAHYGLGGQPARTMKELHNEMGLPRSELRTALGNGLAKLRTELR